MKTCHPCPISVCGWRFDDDTAERPATDLPQRIPGLALAQESHYPCHSRADWAAEAARRGLPGVIENARDFFAAVDGTARMPSRAKVEAVQAELLALAIPTNPQPEESTL